MAGLGLKPTYNGTAALPEMAAAGNLDSAARSVASPPKPPGLGLAKPVAIPDVALPAMESPPVPAPVAMDAPAPEAQQQQSPSAPQQEKFYDFDKNPIGSIGRAMAQFAAGYRGDANTPLDRFNHEQIERQAFAYKTAELGMNIVEAATKQLKGRSADQHAAIIDDLDKRFTPALGGMSLRPMLEAISNGTIKEAEKKAEIAKSLGFSPAALQAFAQSPDLYDKVMTAFLEHSATKQTPEEIKDNARAAAAGTKEGGEQPDEAADRQAAVTEAVERAKAKVDKENGTGKRTTEQELDYQTRLKVAEATIAKRFRLTPEEIEANSAAAARGTASGSGGPKPNEAQQRDAKLYSEAAPQLKIVNETFDALTSLTNAPGRGLEAATGSQGAVGSDYQRGKNAINNIVANYLYSTSGATASPQEVDKRAAIVMPNLSDGQKVKDEKRARLAAMVEVMRQGAGPALGGGGATEDPLGIR